MPMNAGGATKTTMPEIRMRKRNNKKNKTVSQTVSDMAGDASLKGGRSGN